MRSAALSGRRDYALELLTHLVRNGAVDRRMRPIGLADDDGGAGIRGLANRHVQGHLAQKRDAQPLCLVPRPAMAENIRARATMRALEVAHVLDDAEHRHVDLPEHRKPP